MKRIFNTIYLAGILAQIVIRFPHERRRGRAHMVVEHVDSQERTLFGLLSAGLFFIPVTYMSTPWLKRADYRLSSTASACAGATGTGLLLAALWLFWRSHTDLGDSWSPTLQIRDGHALVTRGVYRRIRHPMYASQWLWSLAQPLLLQNWIAGLAGPLAFLPLYLLRVPREEQMLIDQFGDAYRSYMEETGRVIPPWLSLSRRP